MKIHWVSTANDLRTCCGRSIYERGIRVFHGAPKRKRPWECPTCKEKVRSEPLKKEQHNARAKKIHPEGNRARDADVQDKR